MTQRDARLVEEVLGGKPFAIARLMRAVEDDAPGARDCLARLQPHLGRARVVGITGAPGAGKSTLVDQLIERWCERGIRVGVIAIDPSSPLQGGALLGDRIRMVRHTGNAGVFVRSVASRGQKGGLAVRAADLVDILDAAGMDIVVVETVGVGQDGIDVMELAHDTVVVLSPGQGDEIQAMKAGILEIADILVVNKADMDGADRLVRDLRTMLEVAPSPSSGRKPPQVLVTQAVRGDGVESLTSALEDRGIAGAHDIGAHEPECEHRKSSSVEYRFTHRLRELVATHIASWLAVDPRAEALRIALREHRINPDTAAVSALELVLAPGVTHLRIDASARSTEKDLQR